MKKLNVREMALIGILGGVAALLMYIRFPLPFMPPFMDFDFTALPEIIGGFALGPFAAICIIVIKIVVKIALMSTNSMFTGELQNLLLSMAYVLPAVIIYHRHKSKKAAWIGMAVGTIACALLAIATNLCIIIPFYVNLYGMSMESIIQMCAAVNPAIQNTMMLALFGIVPFNLIKNGSVSLITMLMYKKISPILKKQMRG